MTWQRRVRRSTGLLPRTQRYGARPRSVEAAEDERVPIAWGCQTAIQTDPPAKPEELVFSLKSASYGEIPWSYSSDMFRDRLTYVY